MNLPTHWIAALALGIALFHNVELALIMSMGALIPDLDREYFFVARDFIGKHQLHRALCHNFVVAGILYLVSPFLALGAVSHYSLDIFTSATDRGVELLFPFTRLAGEWLYGIEGEADNGAEKFAYRIKPETKDRAKKPLWWVEDPWRLLQATTDRDLREPTEQPWRRSYGPFKNSRIVDWGIFFTSIVFLASFFALRPAFYSLTELLSLSSVARWGLVIFFLGVVAFFGLGEWYQRRPDEKKVETTEWLTAGLILGLILFLAAGALGWIGGIFFESLPESSTLEVLGVGLIAIIVGFVISYAYRRITHDLTL
ncbi:MAG: hypothetical protein ABR979_07375 [Halobacteriota archaeon]|jgi:hypothetical protein